MISNAFDNKEILEEMDAFNGNGEGTVQDWKDYFEKVEFFNQQEKGNRERIGYMALLFLATIIALSLAMMLVWVFFEKPLAALLALYLK